METLIYEVLFVLLGVVAAIAVVYMKKIDFSKVGLDNAMVEKYLEDAIMFAEAKGRTYAKEYSKKLAGSEKLALAKRYLDAVDPAIIKKYGENINNILTRKVEEVFNSKK